jgi:lysine-N-methylase
LLRPPTARDENQVNQRETLRPSYAGAFHCIGPACEDHCCHGWDIPLDRRTYERYQLFPADRLGWAVTGFVSPTPAPVAESLYAHIDMDAAGDCPFLEVDRLCGIQKAYGPELLSSTCSSYPRVLNRVEGISQHVLPGGRQKRAARPAMD